VYQVGTNKGMYRMFARIVVRIQRTQSTGIPHLLEQLHSDSGRNLETAKSKYVLLILTISNFH